MEIRKINKSIEELISGATYLGCGASKEAYLKGDTVYKIPRGRWLIQEGCYGANLPYPKTIEEVDNFLEEVDAYDSQLVWPLGQFAIELVIWDALLQLEKDGLDIGYFARIKDFYLDKNGIIVIEQEKTDPNWDDEDEDGNLWDRMFEEIKTLNPVLKERFNICLRDIREGNCGFAQGKLKLFDFGISTTTSLDCYCSYSDFESRDSYNSYESY